MFWRSPISTRTDTLLPYTTLVRSNFGVVGFVDAGQVYRSSAPTFQNLRFGAGIGARYYTNFGPMRFDIATPIGRKPGEARSEEPTSELQSLMRISYDVFCLKQKNHIKHSKRLV